MISSFVYGLLCFLERIKSMEERIRKYAKFILEGCLKLNEGDKLFIIGIDLINDFIEIVKEEANNLGIFDIKYLISSPKKQKELYNTLTYEEIINHKEFDKTMYNGMAKDGYAFLNLMSSLPNYFSNIDAHLLNKVSEYQLKSTMEYRNYQSKGLIKWNISAVPNEYWANDLFGCNDINKLWNLILDICLIDNDDSVDKWNIKMNMLKERAEYLNNLKIDKLIYKNSLGTNIEIGLPENYLFQSAEGKNIVNMPTEEVFTSPHCLKVNGRVYSSKVLIYNNNVIDKFWLEFKDGVVIDYDALVGKEFLHNILDTDEGSKRLGEVALVDFDSPISKTNVVFKNTLFDENASCHLALGASFVECIKNGLNKNNNELNNLGLNDSCEHVDFFIGTSDLKIIAVLQNGEEKVIMENGNFVMED